MSSGQSSCYAKSAQAGSVVLQCWVKKRWVDFGILFLLFLFRLCFFCFFVWLFFLYLCCFCWVFVFCVFLSLFLFSCFTTAARNLVFAERNWLTDGWKHLGGWFYFFGARVAELSRERGIFGVVVLARGGGYLGVSAWVRACCARIYARPFGQRWGPRGELSCDSITKQVRTPFLKRSLGK